MRRKRYIPWALLALLAGGCGDQGEDSFRLRWPFQHDKKVPVTTPIEEHAPAPTGADGKTGPPPAAAAGGQPMPAVPVPVPSKPVAEPARKEEDKAVAMSALPVNNRYITGPEVLRQCRNALMKIPADTSEMSFRNQAAREISIALRTLVTDALVLGEAEKNMPEELRNHINAQTNEAVQKLVNEEGGGSKDKLRTLLAREGTTLEEVEQDHRKQLTVQAFLQSRFMPAIQVNQPALLDYYRRHRDKFETPKRVQMQIIALPTLAFVADVGGRPSQAELQAAKAKARALADLCVKELTAGTPFDEVAKRHSKGPKARQGGLWPMMAADNFSPPEVEKAAFAIREGQVTTPIETSRGYYLVRAAKIDPGRRASFEEAQVRIEQVLRRSQYNKLTSDYFQRLAQRSNLANLTPAETKGREKFLMLLVEAAVKRYWGKGKKPSEALSSPPGRE